MNLSLSIGAAAQGQPLTWSNAVNPHAFISGGSGMGKSYFLRGLIAQLPSQGVRCVVFDCSHDWAGLGRCADQEYPQAEIMDLKSPDFSISPLRPLILLDQCREDWNDVAFRVAELMSVSYRLRRPQMLNLQDILADFLESEAGPKTIAGLVQYVQKDKKRARRMESVLPRLKTLQRTVTCSEEGISLDISTPGITVLDFSRITTESQQALLVELVLGSLWSQRLEVQSAVPLVVVLDECQKFPFYENGFLVKVLREGRKYDFAGWFSSQWIRDKTAVQALEQAAFRAYFRPEASHIHSLARRMGGGDRKLTEQYERALSGLQRGQFLYQNQKGNPVLARVGG